jgi:hypothetical protein
MSQISSEYATTQIVRPPRRMSPGKSLALMLLLSLIPVAVIAPRLIAFVNRPSRTTALFTGTAPANGRLLVRVYNSGGLSSVMEPRARLQFQAAGLAAATLQIVNSGQMEIPAKGKADLALDLESVWISAGSTNETVAGELCEASGTLQVFVKERDRWGKLHPAAEPLTIELTGRQIRGVVLQRMAGDASKGCP